MDDNAGLFQAFATTLSRLTECFSLFNPWIITPAVSETDSDIHPAITSIGYAVVEPLITWIFLRWPIDPWILLLALSPIHLWLSSFSMDAYHWLHVKAQQNPDCKELAETKTLPISSEQSFKKRSPDQVRIALTLLQPLLTSAMINTALTLFAQSLHAPSLRQQKHVIQILAPFAIVVFLGCRFADYEICRRTRRVPILGDHGKKRLIGALVCLAVLFAVRACIRTVVGLDPFIAFNMPDAIEAERKFGPERYRWIAKATTNHGPWLTWVCIAASVVLMQLGRYFLRRAFSEWAAEKAHQRCVESPSSNCGGGVLL